MKEPTHRVVSNRGHVNRTALSLFRSERSFAGLRARATAFSSYSFMLLQQRIIQSYRRQKITVRQQTRQTTRGCYRTNSADGIYLPTIISSPTPVARHREPATLVAIFSKGSVIIGRPAHNISVPVVCALQRGLSIQITGKEAFR